MDNAKKHTRHTMVMQDIGHETMQLTSMQGTMWVFEHASKHVTSFNHATPIMQQHTNMQQHTRWTYNNMQRGGLKLTWVACKLAKISGQYYGSEVQHTHTHACKYGPTLKHMKTTCKHKNMD